MIDKILNKYNFLKMITESIFKKFVWLDIALWPALFLAFYFQPQTISDLYEVMEAEN